MTETSRKTIKISEVAEVFKVKYPKLSDINVKYAVMKLVTISETKEKKPIILKKVGKTFHLKIKDILVMRHLIRYVPKNLDIKYNSTVINDIIEIAIDLLSKKKALYDSKDKADLSYLIKVDDDNDDMVGHFSIVVRKSTIDRDKDKIKKFLDKFIKDLKTYSQRDMMLISPYQKEKK